MPVAGRAWIVLEPRVDPRFAAQTQAQLAGVGAAAGATTRQVTGLGPRLTRLGTTASNMGRTLTRRLTLPIVGLGALSVKAFTDFNQAMTESTAIMGDVSKEMRAKMESTARSIAKETRFSAKEAAESYFFLASAGLDAAGSIEALPAVAAFAQAGMFDMARATDLLTDAQSALGLTIRDDAVANMENMTRVGDVLVKANTLANASVEQFSEALTEKAGSALRQLNIDLEEGVAVLAAFADQGVKGQRAGTAMNIVLRDLTTQARKNAEQFRRHNVQVFDSEGAMRNLADIVGDLEDALEGQSVKQQRATLAALGFTDKSVAYISSLLGMSDAVRGYEADLREAGGTTEEVAKKQMGSAEARFDKIKSKIVDVGITLGETLLPAVESIAGAIGEVAEAFASLPEGTQKGIIFGLLGAAVAGPFLSVAGGIAKIAGSLFKFGKGAQAAAAGSLALNAAGGVGAGRGAAAAGGAAARGGGATVAGGAAAGGAAGAGRGILGKLLTGPVGLALAAYTLGTIPTAPTKDPWADAASQLSLLDDAAHGAAKAVDALVMDALGPGGVTAEEWNRALDAAYDTLGKGTPKTVAQAQALRSLGVAVGGLPGDLEMLADNQRAFNTITGRAEGITKAQRARIASLVRSYTAFGVTLDETTVQQASNLAAMGDTKGAIKVLRRGLNEATGGAKDLGEGIDRAGEAALIAGQKAKAYADRLKDTPNKVKVNYESDVAAADRALLNYTNHLRDLDGSRATVTITEVTRQQRHEGGLVRVPRLHRGGQPPLGPREQMAVVEDGEYWIRRSRVTPQTLPLLRAINEGATPTLHAGGMVGARGGGRAGGVLEIIRGTLDTPFGPAEVEMMVRRITDDDERHAGRIGRMHTRGD